jgi:hypothetical protein
MQDQFRRRQRIVRSFGSGVELLRRQFVDRAEALNIASRGRAEQQAGWS